MDGTSILVPFTKAISAAFVILTTIAMRVLDALQGTPASEGSGDLWRYILEGTVVGGIGLTLVGIGLRMARTYISATERLLEIAFEQKKEDDSDDGRADDAGS